MRIQQFSEHDSRTLAAYGTNYEKLLSSSMLVVGSDVLAQFILVGLAGLGIRNGIYIIDNKRVNGSDPNDFLIFKDEPTNCPELSKVRYLEHIVKRISPHSKVKSRFFKFIEGIVYQYNPAIIIDATNDPISKEEALNYALNYGIPFISVSSDEDKAIISLYNPNKSRLIALNERPNLENIIHSEFKDKSQGSVTSGVIAGIALEEARKFLFSLSTDDKNLPNGLPMVYNINSATRKGSDQSLRMSDDANLKDKSVLVIGAGGIGTYAALNLALMGIGSISIMDYDIVEDTNLNRQVLYFDSIGRYKAEAMSEMLQRINPDIASRGIKLRMDENFIVKYDFLLKAGKRLRRYDLVLGCVDNREARLMTDEFCSTYRIPYIDGAVDPRSGKVVISIPGKTPSIFQQTNYPKGNVSCAVVNPSVVMSNMIVGSMMAAEGIKIFNLDRYPVFPFGGILRYDIEHPERLYMSQ